MDYDTCADCGYALEYSNRYPLLYTCSKVDRPNTEIYSYLVFGDFIACDEFTPKQSKIQIQITEENVEEGTRSILTLRNEIVIDLSAIKLKLKEYENMIGDYETEIKRLQS